MGYESDMRSGTLHVRIAVMEGGPAMVPIGIAELLRKSAQLARDALPPGRAPRLDVRLVGSGRAVEAADGLRVPVDATFASRSPCDLAIVSAVDADETPGLHRNRAAARWAARVHRGGADVVSVCTGAFVLAEAGLLARRRATTHWAFQGVLAQRFPDVRVEPQAVVVDTGRVCTAGGATSFINLALYLVERELGPEIASAASKMYLIDVNKAPQSAYAIFATQRSHGDDAILAAQTLMEREPASSVAHVAQRVAMSARTFERRFRQATGNSPREYAQRVRVEAAKRALEGSSRSVAEVAAHVGYQDVVAFRRIFQRITGLTPVEHRKRYGALAEPTTIVTARSKTRRRATR